MVGTGRGGGLVAVVSTVKTTVAVTVRHVERNLRAGADHVFLFVDDADPEVCAAWDGHPHVTAVPTDGAYWQGQRPDRLSHRQGVNANLVNLALTMLPEVDWLFSLDADECLHVDRDRLLALDDSVRVVRLTTWEAASRTAGDEQHPQRYKRPLDADELAMLVELGALAEPRMTRYFRGHRRKIGVRPDRRLRLFLHGVESVSGRKVPARREPDALRVLHDESPTLEEFIRKWSAHVHGGGHPATAQRKAVRQVFLALDRETDLTPEQRHAVQQRLYERVALDDVGLLHGLGLLEVPDPRLHRHVPQALAPDRRLRATTMLDALCRVDTSLLHGPGARPAVALRRAAAHLPAGSELAVDLAASRSSAGVPSRRRGPSVPTPRGAGPVVTPAVAPVPAGGRSTPPPG